MTELQAEAAALWRRGDPVTSIADVIGVTRATIYGWQNLFGWPCRLQQLKRRLREGRDHVNRPEDQTARIASLVAYRRAQQVERQARRERALDRRLTESADRAVGKRLGIPSSDVAAQRLLRWRPGLSA